MMGKVDAFSADGERMFGCHGKGAIESGTNAGAAHEGDP